MAPFLHFRAMAPRITALCILIVVASTLATGWALVRAMEPPPSVNALQTIS